MHAIYAENREKLRPRPKEKAKMKRTSWKEKAVEKKM
jgi:hypothetical protein